MRATCCVATDESCVRVCRACRREMCRDATCDVRAGPCGEVAWAVWRVGVAWREPPRASPRSYL